MKIEVSGKNNYNIFINRQYTGNMDFFNKEELISFIKEFILKIRSRLNLRGFYKVKVFPQNYVGLFIELIKLDDLEFSNNLDLRVIVCFDEKFFYETDDYFLIENCNEKRYLDRKFFCIVDDCFEEILSKVEFGRFIYGKEVINLLNKGRVLW